MDGIIFDMDGVLIDTERLFQDCWLIAATEYRLDMDMMRKLVQDCIGLTSKSTEILCRKRLNGLVSYDEIINRVRHIFRQKVIEEGMPVKEGAYILLEYLKTNRITVGLASSTSMKSIREELEQLKMLDYFKVIISGDMVENGKPSPDIYLMACKELNLEPSRTIAIEDSINGLKAAKAAGLNTIMIPDLLPYTEDLKPYVDEHFRSLKDVQEALAKGELV